MVRDEVEEGRTDGGQLLHFRQAARFWVFEHGRVMPTAKQVEGEVLPGFAGMPPPRLACC